MDIVRLPEPNQYLFPPMHVAKAVGWQKGETPTVRAAVMTVLLRQPLPPTVGIVPASLPTSLAPGAAVRKVPRRERIWDLSANLHCSVVGTCLTNGQLALVAAKAREAELMRELEALNRLLSASPDEIETISFESATFLYVGGRPSQVEQLRDLMLKRGGVLLTHDGGVENSQGLLPGLVARADAVFFPVDCVSHGAVAIAKRHCREVGKPFIPLRHASVASFVGAAADHLRARTSIDRN